MKRKTITVGGKRYRKTKPSDLFKVCLYRSQHTRDKDGDEVDSDDTVIFERLCSLKEVIALAHEYYCKSDVDTNGDSMYFDSDYDLVCETDDGGWVESQYTLSVRSTEARIDRLYRVSMPEQYKRRDEWRLAREIADRKEAMKPKLTVIQGDAYMSRPSRAQLKLVS